MRSNITEAKAFLQELKGRTDQARKSGNLFMMNLYTELLGTTTSLIVKAVTDSEDEEQTSTSNTNKDSHNQALRHLIILPTPHEDTLRLKEKLLTFNNHGWEVRDFGAFGAFDCGFLVIEIHNLEGYHAFKKDICSLLEQGFRYVYPEHIVCWL